MKVMKPGLAFSNWYILLTCTALIVLVVLSTLLNLNSSSVNKASSVPLKSESILEIPGNIVIRGNSHTSILHNENSLDGFTGNTGAESKTTPINQSETFSSNFTGSDVQAKRNESEVLLYRKRRYLLFPEGSSFQIVFDLIIPIVDFTNYAIMGITCAVAWELPSKPPSEIEEELRDKLNDGTLGLQRNDSIDNVQYIDTKPLNKNLSNIIYVQPAEYGHYLPSSKGDSFGQPQMHFNSNNRYKPVYTNNPYRPTYYTVPNPNAAFKLKSINNRRIDWGTTHDDLWRPNNIERPPVKMFNKDALGNRLPKQKAQIPPKPRQHAIYHIMGKRSIENVDTEDIDPHLHKLDRIHLLYHRSSRLSLFPKIETMFNTHGLNGTECVLRALCEVGKRRHETEPGNLLTEIYRTIFTLPKVDGDDRHTKGFHPKHVAWDAAYSTAKNCMDAYPLCENFIWMS